MTPSSSLPRIGTILICHGYRLLYHVYMNWSCLLYRLPPGAKRTLIYFTSRLQGHLDDKDILAFKCDTVQELIMG